MQQLKYDKVQSTIKTKNGSKSGASILCNKAAYISLLCEVRNEKAMYKRVKVALCFF